MGERCTYCGVDPSVSVLARWDLHLPLPPPSQNDLSSARGGRAKRFKYKGWRDRYQAAVRAAADAVGVPQAARIRRVTFIRLYAGRMQRFDYGNLVGGMKPLLDAMVRERLLRDDREEFLDDHYHQMRSEPVGVRILIEELGS